MDTEPEDVRRYSLTFALDGDGFFRRSCPSCGLHFKTLTDASQLAGLLDPAFRRIERDYGLVLSAEEGDQERADAVSTLRCPYCRHEDEAPNMLTEEFSQYFLRYAQRELVYPMMREFLDSLDETFNRGRRPTRGPISLEIKFEHDDIMLPVRPIAGPELPDMVQVTLLCCGEAIKILDRWSGMIACPYCGEDLILQ